MIFLYLIVWSMTLPVIASISQTYDVVVVGGTPGGIMAAIAAAREGKSSVILERTGHIGGLPANGLGATDIATREATTGLFRNFTNRIHDYYVKKYGKGSPQEIASSDGFHFEPSVAEKIYLQMLAEYKSKITVLTKRQFDAHTSNVVKRDSKIISIRILNRETREIEIYKGGIFIDATYEGDLGAAAGVPYRVGREAKWEFGEPGAGQTYEYWKSMPTEKSSGMGDNAVQAYNYRICLTNNPKQKVEISKPENYNREEYISLVEDVWTGKNTWKQMASVTADMMEENRRHIKAGGKTNLPGDSWGIHKIVSMTTLPNGKTDANNQHGAFISTDLPEENWPWPTSSWEWRDRFAKRLKDYTLGLLWFAQHDSTLPEHFREDVLQWGLSCDEYVDNGYFPRQVYVREGRRFEGMYFFTAKDALPVAVDKRPPLHVNSITASHYALDSHATRKREEGRVHLDGFISYPTEPYTVPVGVILPKNVSNLILPVPVSGSHIGFSTLRMEPCWMALGEAAGVVAALSIDDNCAVQDVIIDKLQTILVMNKVTLIYYSDVLVDDPDFAIVQLLGIKGFLPDWKARLNETVTQNDIFLWRSLGGKTINIVPGITLRREALKNIYLEIYKK